MRSFFSKLWAFFKGVWQATLRLFNKELRAKHRNLKNMSWPATGTVVGKHIGYFFPKWGEAVVRDAASCRKPQDNNSSGGLLSSIRQLFSKRPVVQPLKLSLNI